MVAFLRLYKKQLGVLVLIVTVLGFVTYDYLTPGLFFSRIQNDLKTIVPLEAASYTDLDGNPVSLEDYKGKPLLINSWATWMPFSQTELPLLARMHEEYGNRITIIAMNRMENPIIIRSYLAQYGIPTDAFLIFLDPTDFFYRAIQGYAMPETIMYRDDGTIQNHIRGTLNETELRQSLETLTDA